MFKNIGKTLRVLAIVLAVLCFIGFAALGTLSLLAALEKGVSAELKTAGIQAAIISYALCVLTPFLNLILYGFGTMITATQEQAQDSKKIKEMLQSALSDGMLSEEIARKSAQAQAKLMEHVLSQMPAAAAKPKKASRAPMQRPVSEPAEAPVQENVTEQAPVAEAPVQEVPVQEVPVQEVPVQEAPIKEAPAEVAPAQTEEKEELQAAPAFIPTKAAPTFAPMNPITPATPTANATVLRPLSGDEETF